MKYVKMVQMSNLQKMKRGMNEFDFSTDSFKNFFKFF